MTQPDDRVRLLLLQSWKTLAPLLLDYLRRVVLIHLQMIVIARVHPRLGRARLPSPRWSFGSLFRDAIQVFGSIPRDNSIQRTQRDHGRLGCLLVQKKERNKTMTKEFS